MFFGTGLNPVSEKHLQCLSTVDVVSEILIITNYKRGTVYAMAH